MPRPLPPEPLPDNDVDGRIVGQWIEGNFPALAEMLSLAESTDASVRVFDFTIPRGRSDEVAFRCAITIAETRLRLHPGKFFCWYKFIDGGEVANARQLARAMGRVCKDVGTPDQPAPDSHLCGLVAESMLGEILNSIDRGHGHPALFEGHDWSVTDPGGDCLAVYRVEDGLSFRLWESKVLYGQTGSARSTVETAADQLRTRAAEYLARFEVVAQRAGLDDQLVDFILRLQDMWLDNHAGAGVGLSLATHEQRRRRGDFRNVASVLDLPGSSVDAQAALAADFKRFAYQVRSCLWGR